MTLVEKPVPGSAESWLTRLLAPLLLWSAFAILLWHALPFFARIAPIPAVIFAGLSALGTGAAYIYYTCRGGPYPKHAWALAPLAAAAAIGVSVLLAPVGGQGMLTSMLFLMAAPIFGDMLSRMVEKKEHMLPALLVAMVADSWSVFHGLSKELLERDMVKHVAMSYPIPDRAAGGITNPVPIVGIMDWIFIAFLLHYAVRFHLPMKKAWISLALGLLAGFILLLALGIAIPLLLTIAPAFALVYWREIRPSPKELLITLAFLACMVTVFFLIGLLRHN